MIMHEFLLLLFILLKCICLVKSGGVPFENVCSSRPTIFSGRPWNQVTRSAFYIARRDDPKFGYRYSIQADRSSRYGSNVYIRSAILRATDNKDVVIGNWETFNGPFTEVFCPLNVTLGYDSSVAVINLDTYPSSTLEAAWLKPTFNSEAFISGYVFDSKKQIHELQRIPAINSNDWYINDIPDLSQCGFTKGCYLVPPNCALQNCLYALTWESHGDHVKFDMVGSADGWVGVGFTNDRTQRDDEYVVCIRANDDSIVHKILHTTSNSQVSDIYDVENELSANIRNRRGRYHQQRIHCTFTKLKKNQLTGYHSYNWLKTLSSPMFIIATFGNRGDIVGDVPNIHRSSQPAIISQSRVNFDREAYPRNEYLAGSWLAKIHLCLMIIAWVLLASIAILTSRYYRPIWNLHSPQYEKKSWLSIHQPLVITVAILTVIAFIFILFEANWGWPHFGNPLWHASLGVVVVILSIINAALVLCIPTRHGRAYCIWFWVHWFVSSLAHCLAIPVIFLGMDLPRLDLWDWCSWLLMAWCIFHIITDLILEIHYCMTYRRNYERFEELENKNRKFNGADGRYPPGYQWKPVCLGFYIVVTLAVVITLIIAIIVYN